MIMLERTTVMGKKYINDPIVEAVSEFRLPKDCSWDLTVPGLIYEKIGDIFYNKEQRITQNVEITQSDKVIQQQVTSQELAQFLNDNKKIFVQVGTRLITINCLAPYPSWEKYMPHIINVFKALNETVKIDKLERIGLRYINKININMKSVDLDHFFEFRPFLGEKLPQNLANFRLETVFRYCDQRDSCRVVMANTVAEDLESTSFILDLDYFLSKPRTVNSDDAIDWVENAHGKVETIFEGCLTQPLRDIFQEEN